MDATPSTQTSTTSALIDDVLSRADEIDKSDDHLKEEMLADYARYICILATGFWEQAIARIFQAYVDSHGDARISRYFTEFFKRRGTWRTRDLSRFIRDFDEAWRERLDAELQDEHRSAIGALYEHRNKIAHGSDTDLAYRQVRAAYDLVKEAVALLEAIVAPSSPR